MIYKFKFNSKEEKHAIEKNNSDKYLIEEQYLIDGNFLVYTDELSDFEMIQKKISILETENEKLKTEQEQQNKDILINMLATTEMYEINRSFNISTFESDSEVKTIKKAPNYIQCTYQRLYELGIKKLEEIPFEIRINLKAK